MSDVTSQTESTEPQETTTTETTQATTTPEAEAKAATTGEDSKSLIGDAEDEKASTSEPLTVEAVQLPEGYEPAYEGAISEFVDIMNENAGDPVALASALINLQIKSQEKIAEAQGDPFEEMQESWIKEAKADPVYGGDKLAPTLGSIKSLIKEVAGKDAQSVVDALDATGAGNNPALIRFLAKVAENYSEGKAVPGNPGASTQPKDLAHQLYPNLP